MTISDPDTAKTVASTNASLICKAILPTENLDTSSISDFKGKPIFDHDAMKDYVEKEFIHSTGADTIELKGSTIEDLVTNISNSLSADASYSFPVGASVSGSLSVDFNTKKTCHKSVSFAQNRLMAKFGNVVLPDAYCRDELRALVKPAILEEIDKIDNQRDADSFVNSVGAVYIDSARFGATLTMSSSSKGTKITSAEHLSVAVRAEMNYLTAKVSAHDKFNIGTNEAKQTDQFNLEVRARGGNPTYILKGDQEKWIDSTKDCPTITNYVLASISNLAKKGSKSEAFLLTSVKKICDDERSKFEVIDDPTIDNPQETIESIIQDAHVGVGASIGPLDFFVGITSEDHSS